ncbi:MAG: hypothetical protein GY847_02635 [Proteobacteria bacterium]|nr:hypothetical protein [Pseudomonadota bacterium]
MVLDTLTDNLLGAPISVRQLIVGLLVGVLAVPMSIPFPLSLRKLGQMGPAVVPRAWGINGSASVLGSILCIFIAMWIGFKAVLIIAAGLYLLALPNLLGLLGATPTRTSADSRDTFA